MMMTSQKTVVSTTPTGLLRWLLRLPITLYRLRLGWLLGERFVLLQHIGRKSGQVRTTVVEIIGHDKPSDTYYIASGWGYKSHWYQNLLTTPSITIRVGRRKLDVCVETLSPSVGAQVLLDYRKKHPLAAGELSRLMGLDMVAGSPAALEKMVHEALPIVALRPQRADESQRAQSAQK